jgi:uncharacterized protein YjaZ
MKADTDLASVRSDRRFRTIVERVQENEQAYQREHSDPNRAAIVTSDIDLFWDTYASLQASPHPEELIENEYFHRGSPGLRDFIFARIHSVTTIPAIVAHELVHYEQSTEGKTLLAAALVEGSADFIGGMISGGQINETAREYGLQHESELWAQFKQEMHGTDTSHWMYEGKVVNGRPADLAYFMGYRIAEAYYNKAPNKKEAIAEILNFKDADKLLNDSGYADRFEKPGAMQGAAASGRARADIRAGLRGGRLWVEQRLDGSLAVKFRERYVSDAVSPPAPDPSSTKADDDLEEGSSEGRPHLDEGLQPAEEPTAVGDPQFILP